MLRKAITRILLTMFFVCMLLSAACTTEKMSSQDKNVSNPPAASTSIPSGTSTDHARVYRMTLADKLEVDAIVDMLDIDKASIIQVEKAAFDPQKFRDVFFPSKDAKEEKEEENIVFTSGNKSLSIGEDNTSFDFRTPLIDYVIGIVDTDAYGNLYKFKSEELDFMPKQKAVAQAKEILNSLGISFYKEPRVYALDFKTLQQEQERCLEEEAFKDFVALGKLKLKDRWTKDDEFYYLFFRIDVRGIPCESDHYTNQASGLSVQGSEIEVIISKNGVEGCMLNGAIYREIGSKGNASPLISIEQALDSLKKKYDQVILTGETRVTGISLVYTPVLVEASVDRETGEILSKQMELVPVWLFEMQQKYEDSRGEHAMSTKVRINAITGKELQ